MAETKQEKPPIVGAVRQHNHVRCIWNGADWLKSGDLVEFLLDGLLINGYIKSFFGMAINVEYETLLEGKKTASRLPGHVKLVSLKMPADWLNGLRQAPNEK